MKNNPLGPFIIFEKSGIGFPHQLVYSYQRSGLEIVSRNAFASPKASLSSYEVRTALQEPKLEVQGAGGREQNVGRATGGVHL